MQNKENESCAGSSHQEAGIKPNQTEKEGKDTSESSDNDKTSGSFGSLFKSNGTRANGIRRNELPDTLFKEYMSIDEFCSTNSSDTRATSSGFVNVRFHTRSHFDQIKARVDERTPQKNQERPGNVKKSKLIDKRISDKVDSNKISTANRQALNKYAIAEMDRQYDHNVCLDRFINEIEHKQQQKQDQEQEGLQLTTKNVVEKHNIVHIDKYLETVSLATNKPSGNPGSDSNSSLNKIDCCNSSGGCLACTSGSSSLAPRSNDGTDSRSQGSSSSVKSSTSEKEKVDKKSNNLNSSDSTGALPNSWIVGKRSSGTESGIEVNCSSAATGTTNSSINSSDKKYKGGKLGRKRKRDYIYNPKPVKGKPPKKRIPDAKKDNAYWEKRKRNNEAARKSREMRRNKELEINGRLGNMMKENEALRVAVTLLVKRNETLECVLNEYSVAENDKTKPIFLEVPVTC